MTIGAMTRVSVCIRPAPSSEAASNSAGGMSARKDRIIQTAIGRFIAVYRMIRNQMLVQTAQMSAAMRNSGASAAAAGRNLVDRKKDMTSVHFLTGLTDNA